MDKDKIKLFLIFIIGLLTAFLGMYLYNNYKIEKKNQADTSTKTEYSQKNSGENSQENSIDQLTNEDVVINYVKENRRLPDYYITKTEARNQGWIASKGNLCEVLPGKAIGGDKFSNREKTLPSGNQYFEADVNYNCGNRNADRIIYTKNGEVWLTKNHYKTFEKQ
ncbi:ribonuclease N [Flavobacteriaceae bacterium JJC]|nr:ribonuclease N [Flavobacteriaceae bacterium JJC]